MGKSAMHRVLGRLRQALRHRGEKTLTLAGLDRGRVEALLAAAIVGAALYGIGAESYTFSQLGLVADILPALFLWLRHRWPAAVLAASAACYCVVLSTSTVTAFSLLPVAVSIFSYVVRRGRAKGMAAMLVAVATIAIPAGITDDGSRYWSHPISVVLVGCLALAMGVSVRNQRAYVAAIVARAEQAEATREAEAVRRVSEERLRTARDLHDIVGHQLSVISMNSSVALISLDTKPDQARSALQTIQQASKQAIGDIGALLAVLRSEDAAVSPQPGLAELDQLIEEWRRAGLSVTCVRRGLRPRLSPTADMVAYRALQEALTNAARHGSASRANVEISSKQGHIVLVVTNPASSGFDQGGFGLTGMRERVMSVRGSMDYSMSEGVFRLEVRIPALGFDQEEGTGSQAGTERDS
ncbi:MAG: histidine kinase [Actinomycetaceae bacterium]|nr:histidine kinase [Actinomycetaceae bacterium]